MTSLLLIVAYLDTGQDYLLYILLLFLPAAIITELWMEKESMEYYKGKVIMNMEGQYKQFSFPEVKKQHVH